jgi:TonB family protein
MNKITQILFIFILNALFANFGFAQQEKVYARPEVDTKAIIKKVPRPKAVQNWDCPAEGEVILQVILHYSGKVTKVELTKGLSCGYDEKAIAAAQKIKFTPAIKDGQLVSQTIEIKFNYTTKLK